MTSWSNKKQKLIFIKNNLNKYKLSSMLEAIELKRSYWDKYKNKIFENKDQGLIQQIQQVLKLNKKMWI